MDDGFFCFLNPGYLIIQMEINKYFCVISEILKYIILWNEYWAVILFPPYNWLAELVYI